MKYGLLLPAGQAQLDAGARRRPWSIPLPYPPDPADYATAPATIRDTATRPIAPALFATLFVDDDAQRGAKALDDYCRTTYRMPWEAVAQIQVMMTGPDIPAQLGRFVEAGARHILLRLGAVGSATFAEQLARVAEILSVLPRAGLRGAGDRTTATRTNAICVRALDGAPGRTARGRSTSVSRSRRYGSVVSWRPDEV